MPLDTQPLTPARRALLVFVLFLCFLGSLGLAKWLSDSRRTAIALSVVFPPGFNQTIQTQLPGVYAARAGEIDGEPRQLYYFSYEHIPAPQLSMQLDEAERLYEAIAGEPPAWQGATGLANHVGIELRNFKRPNGGFTWLRFTVIADRAIAVLYSGSGPITDADKELFNRVCEKLRAKDMNATRPDNPKQGND